MLNGISTESFIAPAVIYTAAAVILLLTSISAKAQSDKISTISGGIQKKGSEFFVFENTAPGRHETTPASGHPDVLEAATERTRQIGQLLENRAAGGLFNPLSIQVRSQPDGTVEVISFSGQFADEPDNPASTGP
jgi:hypothetical protein